MISIRSHETVHYMQYLDLLRACVCAVTKWSKTHRNMCLGSNGVDWTRSLWKNLIWIRTHEIVHYMQYWDPFYASVYGVTKWSKTLPNITLGSKGLDCTSLLQKKSDLDSIARNRALPAILGPVSRESLCCNEMVRNTPKHYFRV
jgi:hypothetical protein